MCIKYIKVYLIHKNIDFTPIIVTFISIKLHL